MDDFMAYNSRWRVALLLLGCVAFVMLGLWMAGIFGEPPNSRRYSPGFLFVVGWSSVLLFGVFGLAGVRKFFDASVQLEIGTSGIRWSPWSDRLIPWSEIADVTTWRSNRQRMIVLRLHHPERFPRRGLAANFAAVNRKLTGGDIAITLTGTNRGFEEAMSAIARHRG
jgi:hypothetical protein